MFQDVIKLKVKAGKGGDGIASFRREKYVQFGGPDGGRGGNGGNIILKGDRNLNNLYRLTSLTNIKAENGQNGMRNNCYGKNGQDYYVNVPLGVIVKTINNEFIGEVLEDKEELIVAHGGIGGRGNYSYRSSKNQAPDYAEPGTKGEELEIVLELKTIADCALVGMPNAGKSTFLKMTTNANPKIANYPFTTLNPNLGILDNGSETLIIADIPGLIENASKGQGLGILFLKHIERCKIILHIIDISNENPFEDYKLIINEIKQYNEKIIKRPSLVFLNKSELVDKKRIQEIKKEFTLNKVKHIIGNNFDKEIIAKIKDNLFKLIKKAPEVVLEDTINLKKFKSNVALKNLEIYKEKDIYYLKGDLINKLFYQLDFNKEDSILRFSYRLKKLGIENILLDLGIKKGDTVNINNYEFTYE